MIYAVIGKLLDEKHKITGYRVAVLTGDVYGVDHILRTKAYRDTNIMRFDDVRNFLVSFHNMLPVYYLDVQKHLLKGQIAHWKNDDIDEVWFPDTKYLIPIVPTDRLKPYKKTNIVLFRKTCSDGATVYFVLNYKGYISVYTKATILRTLDKEGYSNAYVRNLDDLVITGADKLATDIDENVANAEQKWKAAYVDYIASNAKTLNQVADTPVGRAVTNVLNATQAYRALDTPPAVKDEVTSRTAQVTTEEKYITLVEETKQKKDAWMNNLGLELQKIQTKKEQSAVIPTATQLFNVLGKGSALLGAVGGLAGGPAGGVVGGIANATIVATTPLEYMHDNISQNKVLSASAKKLLKSYINNPDKGFILYQLTDLVGSDLGHAKSMGKYKHLSSLKTILYEYDTQKIKKIVDKHKTDYYFNPIYPALRQTLLQNYTGEHNLLNGLKLYRKPIVDAIEIAYISAFDFIHKGGVRLTQDTHAQLQNGVIYQSDNYTVRADSLREGVWTLGSEWEMKTTLQLGTYYLDNLSELDARTLDRFDADIGLLCSPRMVYKLSLLALYYALNTKMCGTDTVAAFKHVTTECFDAHINVAVNDSKISKAD